MRGWPGEDQSAACCQSSGPVRYASVCQSSLTSRNNGKPGMAAAAARPRAAARPAPAPAAAPSSAMASASIRHSRTRSHRLAPRAARIAISRPRPSPLARKRPSTLAHAIRRTAPTSIRKSAASASPCEFVLRLGPGQPFGIDTDALARWSLDDPARAGPRPFQPRRAPGRAPSRASAWRSHERTTHRGRRAGPWTGTARVADTHPTT